MTETCALTEAGRAAAREIVKALANCVVDAVRQAGEAGVPAGYIYARLMEHVPSLSAAQFNALVRGCVDAGKITRSGHLLRIVP